MPRARSALTADAIASVDAFAWSQVPGSAASVPRLMFTTRTSGRAVATQLSADTICPRVWKRPCASSTLTATSPLAGATPSGATAALELAPGGVLTALVKRALPGLPVTALRTAADLLVTA